MDQPPEMEKSKAETVWPPPPTHQAVNEKVVAKKPIGIPVLCLLVSFLSAAFFNALLMGVSEGQEFTRPRPRDLTVPVMALCLVSYWLVFVCIVWLRRTKKQR